MPDDENDAGEMRGGARREYKQRKKREAQRMHGASLRRIYRDAILKRLRRGQSEAEAASEKDPSSDPS